MIYANFGKRLLAYLIDALALSAFGGIFAALYGYFAYMAVFWIVGALYFILFEGSSWHATLGKKAMGIMVVDSSGNGIDYGTAAVRYLGKILSCLTVFIGYIMAAFTDKSQALHDKVAGTYVIDAAGNYAGNRSGRQVVGISGEFAGQSAGISAAGVMIGRDPVACRIALSASSPGVSRHHCQVDYNLQTGMFIVNDLGSTYGTYLMDGTKLTSGQPAALRAGERFCVGSRANIFEVR
ncbi:RDD family protein [Anaerostipes sp.]|uniref:RDD family protein n=1 Tax=Anaerostipes sp. TaxID=1872530 RepID=UPI0025BE1F8C|nr:RDD family protein [Anaerostipes sp.]MBS7008431.1 RDD family protein [Anaerostipes sp.]